MIVPVYIKKTFYNCGLWCTNILVDQENEKNEEGRRLFDFIKNGWHKGMPKTAVFLS